MVHRPKPVTISVAHNLPEEQRAWCCPLCTAALPSLSDWDRKRAIRKHIEEAHPDETLQSLYNYRKKHIQKPGVRAHNHDKYVKARQQRHKTHDIVAVDPTERNAKGRAHHKGRKFYCRNVWPTSVGIPNRSKLVQFDAVISKTINIHSACVADGGKN